MRDIFHNIVNQQKFDTDGYIIVPLFAPEEVKEMGANFYKLNKNQDNSFFSTLFSHDVELKIETDIVIKKFLGNKLDQVLINFKPIIANYVVKFQGENSVMHPHQDWSFVDEDNFNSLNIWFPISKTNFHKGSLHVFKGSHKWEKTYRGTNIDSAVDSIVNEIRLDSMTQLEVPLGSIVIYDHRLIHASPPNKSSDPRIAAAAVYIPEEADLLHYCKVNEVLKIYSIDSTFFYDYIYVSQKDNIIPEKFKVISEIEFNPVNFHKKKFKSKKTFLNKVKKKLFN